MFLLRHFAFQNPAKVLLVKCALTFLLIIVRIQGYSARSKVVQHGANARDTQHDGVVSYQSAYNQCNLYGTATRRTVAAQYSADAASLGRSVQTQRNRPGKTTELQSALTTALK